MRAKIGRWGGSLAVRLPAEIVGETGFAEGQSVEITPENGGVKIRRAEPKLTVEEMFRGRSSEEWRSMYRDHFDWGPDVGREIIDE